MKRITFGVLAHVDAGKTTLSEAMLYRCGVIRRLGRVDHGDAFFDTDGAERARGITIFSKQAVFEHGGCRMTLIDTPGHVDFSAEMERCLSILDYAVLVVSGTSGVQSHTRTLWQLLRRYQIPTFVFVNKMDAAGTDRAALLHQLQAELNENCLDFSARDDEQLALCGEDVMERYLQTGSLADEDIAALAAQRRVFPCFFGSALRLNGVDELLDGLSRYTRCPNWPQEFSARVFKIARDGQGTRLTFLKVTGGELKVKALLRAEDWQEKADQLREYSGDKFTLLQSAPAGTVCAVTGLSRTRPGDGLGVSRQGQKPILQPVLEYRLTLDGGDVSSAFAKLRQLEEEDPQLHLVWHAQLREIRAQLMGEVQMEILQRKILERFGLHARFDEGSIVYKETIAEPVLGVGHYEPLRHYAEVHLLLEPGEPGSGLRFDTICAEDTLARSWQRLILTHLAEREHPGVLTGAPITDLRITITAGRAHEKHTEGGDFRQATYRAVRQGLKKAKSVLLEPYYSFRLELPCDTVGRAMTDIQRMQGVFDPPETAPDGAAILCGSAPVRLLRGYQREVTAYTRGQGRLSCQVSGYRPCADQRAVVQQIRYQAERDLDNPTGSVFCAHGAGFEVKWDEVDRYAHLPLLELRPKQPAAPERIVRAVAPGGSAALEKELLAIFERTYGAIRRRDVLPMMALRSEHKRELLEQLEPVEEYLLVDGYNIIFAWDELKAVARDNLDAARHMLMHSLCNYQGYRGCALILVFDAYRVAQNLGSVEKYHNIYIVYTKEAETADQYIERVTYELRARRRRVRVATSDSLEQLIILGHNAERVSAEQFHEEVADAARQIARILEENNRKNS